MKIFVKLKIKSSQEKVEKVDDKNYKIWVKEPPVNGRANKALIEVLADYFDTSKSSIRILRGHKSRKKIIEIKK